MATLTIGGAAYAVAPFKLRELRRAGPAIDRIAARAKEGASGVASMAESLGDMLEVLAAGIEGTTRDSLEAEAGIGDAGAVQRAFADVLAEAGLKSAGEGRPAPAPADPSQSASTTSSPNLSAPDAGTGTA